MDKLEDLQQKALLAARDQGISSVLFRNVLAKKLGLNLSESFCLTILGIKGNSTPTELAHYTGLSTGSTTTMLDRLEEKGFIKRMPNPTDRRGIIIEIAEGYAKSAPKLVEGIQKAHRQLIARYTSEQLEIIIDFLQGFTKNLEEEMREMEKE